MSKYKECSRCNAYSSYNLEKDNPRHPCTCRHWNSHDCDCYKKVTSRLENNEPLVEFIGAFALLFQSIICVASIGLLRPMPYERFVAWKVKRNLGY